MKKLLSVLLVMLIVTSTFVFVIPATTASAETDGYYTYTVSNGKATITDVSKSISGAITIPSTLGGYPVISIGDSVFSDCTGLTSITIPDSVTNIGNYAFYNCIGLTSIEIPDNVTSIGNYAFYNCYRFKTVDIGNGVKDIGDYAFRSCTLLTSIAIPDSVKYIGEGAFYNCIALANVTECNGVANIGTDAFYNTAVFNDSSNYENGALYIGKVLIKVQKTLSGNYTVKDGTLAIAPSAFEGCTGLKSIKIPESVEIIGEYAFSSCAGLTSVTIPDSVTSIGRNAFYGCYGLTTVTIGNGVQDIGGYAFRNCTRLNEITIPDSVTSIGQRTFYNCTGLTTVNFNAINCTNMGNGTDYRVFYGCTNLTTLNIGENVTKIPDNAFYGCTGLKEITIPENVTSIGDYAFYGCTDIVNVKIGNGVTSIGSSAFSDCTGLTSVTIPDSVTSIGQWAFDNCTGLKTLNFNAINCASMGSSNNSAFYGCTKLTTVNIGENVTNIPSYAFYNNSGISDVVIGKSVTSIGNYAFSGCTGIKSVRYVGTEEEWSKITVGEGNEEFKLVEVICIGDDFKPTVAEIESNFDNIIISNAWVKRFDNHFSGRYALHTTTGGKVQFSFTGTQFEFVSYKSPSQGKMYISIDGGQEIEVSLYDEIADTYFKETVFTSDELMADIHTVTVRVEGKAVLDAINLKGKMVKCETPIKDNVRIEVENIRSATYTGNWSKVYAWMVSAHNAMKSSNGTVTFDFEGDMLSIISYKAKTQGKLYVSIDGNDEIEVDLYDDSTDKLYQEKVFTEHLDYDNHTVTIRTSGAAIIDAIEINRISAETVTYEAEDTDLGLSDGWKNVSTWPLSNHKALQGSNGAYAKFTYTGYDFKIISYKARSQGKMYVFIDDTDVIEVDLYDNSTDTKYKEIALDAAGLDYGTHSVEIIVVGTVILDAIKIDGTLN